MTADIVKKLQILNCPVDMYNNALKFTASLAYITPEQLKEILDYLLQAGVIKQEEGKILLSPAAFQILPNGLEYIKKQVEDMKAIGEIECYVEKPARINIRDAYLRLKYMKDHNVSYRNENGKYSKAIFSKLLFIKQYGNVDLTINEKSIPAVSISEDAKVSENETIVSPVIESEVNQFTPTSETPSDSLLSGAEDKLIVEVPEGAKVSDDAYQVATESDNVEVTTNFTSTINVNAPELNSGSVVDEIKLNKNVPVDSVVPEETPDDSDDGGKQSDTLTEVTATSEASEIDMTAQAERFERIKMYISDLYIELFGLPVPDEMIASASELMKTSQLGDADLIFELFTKYSSYSIEQKMTISSKINEVIASRSGEMSR